MTSTSAAPINLLIVDDHQIVTDALSDLFTMHMGFRLTGVASTVAGAVALVQARPPDVILMDYLLPDGTGSDAVTLIRPLAPNVKIVFLSASESRESLLRAVEAGASGFLLKSEPPARIVEAVRRAAAGDILIPPAVLAELVVTQRLDATAMLERHTLMERLSKREMDVLRLMAEGMNNRTIAEQLAISLTTVRTHVSSVLSKLGVHSKLEAVLRATDLSLVE